MNTNLFKYELSKLSEGFWEVKDLPKGTYDSGMAAAYDKMISSKLYNRLMWGSTPADYQAFAAENISEHKTGAVADIGCGSLSFTAEIYAKQKNEILLCDFSTEMLKMGKKRLESYGTIPSEISFIRANALDMPLANKSMQTVVSYGFINVIENRTDLLNEIHRILKPNGNLHITSLCTNRKLSARYLKLLHKKGHVATPLSSEELINIVNNNGFSVTKHTVKGGIVYISAYKQDKI